MPYFSSRPQTVAAWSFYLLTVTLVAAGCGKNSTNGHVAGRVTLVGNPFSKGSVMFQNPESGVTLVAGIQSDGAYRVKSYKEDGVPPGTYQVAVQPQSPTTKRPQFVARPATKDSCQAAHSHQISGHSDQRIENHRPTGRQPVVRLRSEAMMCTLPRKRCFYVSETRFK